MREPVAIREKGWGCLLYQVGLCFQAIRKGLHTFSGGPVLLGNKDGLLIISSGPVVTRE